MEAEGPPQQLRAWLEAVHARWQALGVAEHDQAVMGAELAADIGAALTEGAVVEDFVRTDPTSFADAVAEASGTVAVPVPTVPTVPTSVSEPDRVGARAVAAGLAAATLAGLACWFVGYGAMSWWVDMFIGRGALEVVAIFSVHIAFGLLVLASALAAIASVWRPTTDLLPTFGRLGAWVAAFGIAAIPPTVGLAWSTGFSTDLGAVTAEVLVVGVFVAYGIHTGLRRVRSNAAGPATR